MSSPCPGQLEPGLEPNFPVGLITSAKLRRRRNVCSRTLSHLAEPPGRSPPISPPRRRVVLLFGACGTRSISIARLGESNWRHDGGMHAGHPNGKLTTAGTDSQKKKKNGEAPLLAVHSGPALGRATDSGNRNVSCEGSRESLLDAHRPSLDSASTIRGAGRERIFSWRLAPSPRSVLNLYPRTGVNLSQQWWFPSVLLQHHRIACSEAVARHQSNVRPSGRIVG
jgi:hypothetical protein